jgi:pyruvate dehydrogenase (quinone)/pyruvate oxidase
MMVSGALKRAGMRSLTAADVLIDTLYEWGVDTIFGLPGDGINGIMESLRQRQDKIRFVHVRHEESAAFMACAYAKYTGKLGVCLATSGPGGIHLLNGLYDARMDGQPVLALTGAPYHDLIGTFTQQDVALDKLFADVCVYNERVMGPSHVENLANQACRSALSRRGVAHITFPTDLQDKPLSKSERSHRNVPLHVSEGYYQSVRTPSENQLAEAAEILNSGEKIVILAGRGALHASDEVLAVAEKLNAPIVKPLLGKAAIPDDSVYCIGGSGLLGTRPAQEALDECDTLLMVGTSFPYIEFFPKPGQARAVQIDLEPDRIGARYPVQSGLVGDAKSTLQKLIPLLQANGHKRFLEKAQNGMARWWELMKQQGSRMDKPMKPQVVAWELGKLLNSNAIVSCDSGTIATWWARQIPVKKGQMYSLSGNLATMACGLPYAIAAQVAYPDRQSVAFVGDGGLSMLMAEFSTCVKFKLPVKVVVIKNNTLGQIKWEQMVFLGNPEYGNDLQPIDFASFARDCGGRGYTVDDPRDCGRVLSEALAYPGPVIVEAVVDPFEPPMPGKISPEQAVKFAESLARGEPNRKEIALTILKDKVRELI